MPFAGICLQHSHSARPCCLDDWLAGFLLLTNRYIVWTICFMKSSPDPLTEEARFCLQPASPAHRQYEALRAFFVDGISSQQAAERFGYSHGSFRVLCHHFRRSQPDFFRDLKPGPRSQPKKDAVRQLILAMRKQNLSVYDIERSLKDNGTPLSVTAIWEILHEEGFARLPRRQDEERPDSLRPSAAAVADGREFSLLPRTTQFGGRFLFLPFLARCGFPELVKKAGYPGTKMIPATQALLAILGLKLSSTERKSHVMDLVFDQGLALWAGLNVVPKTTYLATYSHSVSPRMNECLRDAWIATLQREKLLGGKSFNLDFPFPTSGKTSSSSTTTCPNGVAARNRFWSFWLRTPIAKWSAIPAPTSYAAIRPMRYSVLSSFGRRVTAVCPPSWSSIPASPPMPISVA